MPWPPYWVWAVVVLGAFVLRFYCLDPMARLAQYRRGINRPVLRWTLSRNGTDASFITSRPRLPPGMVWLLTPLISLLQNPLEALWLLPACLSFLAALLTYGAARPYFSKSFSFLVFLFSALSFWPVFFRKVLPPGGPASALGPG